MGIILDFKNQFETTDFTAAINEEENRYGFVNSQNLFDSYNTSEKAVVFDKNTHNITLIPQVNRGSHTATTGKERAVETFSLPLAYFNHVDSLGAEDIYRWRQPGSTDKETVTRAAEEKVQDLRYLADQQTEYLKLQALKGIFKTPDGATVANMFTLFGITQQEVDFTLNVSTTDINAKILDLKRKVKAGLKTSTMNGVDVYLAEDDYDALVNHSQLKAYYLLGDGASRVYRENTASYEQWGVMDMFEHKGVRFIQYNPTFNLPNGATEDFLTAGSGIALPRGARGLFRTYNGPSNKMSQIGEPGQPMFLRTYVDPRDEFIDFQLEMSNLSFCTQPNSIVKFIA